MKLREASIIFIIFVFLTFGILLFVRNVYRSMFARFDVAGVVLNEGARFKGSSTDGTGSLTQKLTFQVKTNYGTEYANCDDTRCAAIQKGQHVVLNCYEEIHLFSPNELECRFRSAD